MPLAIQTAPISTATPPRPLAKLGEPWPPAARTAAAPEQRGQTPLQIAQHVVQIVLRLLGAVPGIALLAARFVPSHSCA